VILSFTPATLEYASLMAALDGACFDSEVFSEDMLVSLMKTPYVFGFIALADKRPIGYNLVSVAGRQGDLLTIGIIPEFRGRGLGRDCLIHLLKEASVRGIKELFLEVRPTNVAAVNLYVSFGATKEGLRKNYYVNELTGEKEDAIVMRLPV
tara:strand:+ start:60099 stop:60554 length:456 start_codon:yes stop_codon:yes gene_type:complete